MYRYSGGGAEVMQQLLMDVTGQPFPELMKRLVLGPALYEQLRFTLGNLIYWRTI